ncbi:uncharacterized protein Z518_00986 [Rhinocladiella mackenziei CBS 650.93]|uniref:HMA domain-containing protein n=1 Tax=Rhinocladiella mackenziei CBS 650.93 TaxID=1442369 RepID=A0A0D2JK79_9EURO|nr:uncharacterized protein Z518_00986 [Rhinocladiella mackenziei CBS 650.93]KIX09905.1 hypothetical protein Z518_00986 [Rhinocladiella mackenziei CBS 650.93]
MACCIFTAYFMSRIIKACELFDIRLLDIKYNDFDPDAEFTPGFESRTSLGHPRYNSRHKTNDVNNEPRDPKSEPLTTTRLFIKGMTCSACVSTLTHALTSHPSVIRINISLVLSRATIIYNSHGTSIHDLISLVEDAGYGAEVLGQGNNGSAADNLRLVRRDEELQELKKAFNGAAKWATCITMVEWVRKMNINTAIAPILDPIALLFALVIACYDQLFHARWIHRNAWAACYSKRGLQLPTLSMDTLLSLSLLLSIVLSLFNIALYGLLDPQRKTYFLSTSFLTVVISGGRYLDVTLKRQGAAGFGRLLGLQMDMEWGTFLVEGRIRKNGDDAEVDGSVESGLVSDLPPAASRSNLLEPQTTSIPASLLAPIDVYRIPPQSLIPCDSYVIRGASLVDESNMTGESIACRKSVGDFLMSGTRNLSDGLVAVVLKGQTESSLERVVESIQASTELKYESAQNSTDDSPDKSLVDIMTRYFVSAVLILTSLCFTFTLFTSTTSISRIDRLNMSCERAMAILAAACPCALGLANPSAIMAGIDACYAHGVLVPGGSMALKKVARLTHIVLDKTGTLTDGRLQISDVVFAQPFYSDPQKRELLYSLLCAAERDEAQTHPVGRAVFQWCLRQLQLQTHARHDGQTKPPMANESGTASTRNISAAPGKGISCEVHDVNNIWYTVHIGSERFLTEYDINIPPSAQDTTTIVHFSLDHKYAGTFTLQDKIRSSAPSVIESLKSLGLSLTMLTGDSEIEAHRVSSELAIPVLAAKSLPHEKRTLVESLQTQSDSRTKNIVAMLGDGLNDAPAQAAADVGILFSLSPLSRPRSPTTTRTVALGTSAADVILMTPDLASLPKLIQIARKTVQQAQWNIWWAVVYNAVAVSLAMGAGEWIGLGSIDA